ncbi:molybdopterin-dependent oxidoreductase [Streptomyces gamaensis]|uniref:Molybdopterin-dependent oxidoreductase n=1 Tax=Streptomyces gamaensis TaxID=1763542 RepID=A0ABW0YV87_9ACTN
MTTAPAAPRPTDTHCPYCALQCGMRLHPVTRSAPGAPGVEIGERPDFPVNLGALCGKGRSAADPLDAGVRLTAPLVRDAGRLREAGWDEALDRAARGLRTAAARYGREAVGVFGGGGLTNEKAYLLGKFARVVLRTPHIDYNGRFCMSSAAAAQRRAFGLDRGLPFPLADIPRTGCVLLVGSNVAETMPPALRYFRELREAGGRLVVVDPRRTRTAELADLHLRPVPGTDLALALGLLHLVIADGHVDHGFVAARTSGYEHAHAAAMAHWPERVERITGVSVPLMRRAVELFCGTADGMVLTARGGEQHSKGVDTVGAWIDLCLATGRAGRPRCGYGCLTGQGNGQGGREHGQKSDQLPGYRSITDPAARAHVAGVWGVPPQTLPGPGRSAYELLDALGTPGGPRALLVMGSNPVVSAPRAGHVTRRLRALDTLVVCDVVRSETAELADVVLPSAQWAEEDGTMTNLEGRVLLRRAALTPPPGVRTDLTILRQLAARLGVTHGFPTEPEKAFTELRRASAGGPADYSGITYERIAAENGVFWPCPSGGAVGVCDPAGTADPAAGTAGTGAGPGASAGYPASTVRAADSGAGGGACPGGTADAVPDADLPAGTASCPGTAGGDTCPGCAGAVPTCGARGADRTGAGAPGSAAPDAGAIPLVAPDPGSPARTAPPHPGTPRLFLTRFATPDGRARFSGAPYRPAAEETDPRYPVWLTTGRVGAQYQSGAQTRRSPALNAAAPGPYVELHPDLAGRLGVVDGEAVTVTSRRGQATAPAVVTGAIRPDTVFMPFHWPGPGRANSLTNPALDPVSRMPEFKVCAVRVDKAGEQNGDVR